MSGHAFTRTPLTTSTFGPRRPDLLELRGIRRFFPEPDAGAGGGGGSGNAGGDGNGGGAGGTGGGNGNGYVPPTSQAELDRIITERLTRERARFSDYDELKAKAEELEKVKDAQKSADEKAIDAAREEGRAEVRQTLAQERVRTALERELQGRQPNAAALLDLDRSKFVKGDGADTDAIKAWVLANSTEVKQPNPRDPGQGTGGGESTSVESGRSAYKDRHPARK